MEREYTVIAKSRKALSDIEVELTSSESYDHVPQRSVVICNPRLGSRIQTHFLLTDEEADALRNDPRVRAVEIPPDQRDDISIGLNASQQDGGLVTFYRGSGTQSNYANWGLKRSAKETNEFVSGNTRTTTSPGDYEYAIDGTGVDVVIQDSGIDPNHPDWNDSTGTSRLQQIDWYTESGLSGTQSSNHYRDRDGHGSHCASIAAGRLYGWAKGAHIYSQKLQGLETLSGSDGTGIPIADAFDAIRLWHNAKTNGRPTVVNMSWGYGATISTDPTSGVYRGTAWTYGVDYSDRGTLEDATGVSIDRFIGSGSTTFFRMPVRVASVDAEVEDMIADGIHVCIAAGNDYTKSDVAGGPDWDNTVVFNSSTYNYHQGSSPWSQNAYMVGNIDSGFSQYLSETYTTAETLLDQTASSTKRGPGTNIFAPGTNIMAATSTEYDTGSYTVTDYPLDNAYPIMSISGTSMASPQVCGVVAQHLQRYPDLTPAQMQQRIFNESTATMYTTGVNNDYGRVLDSLMGAPNRVLFNRYSKQPITTNAPDVLTYVMVNN